VAAQVAASGCGEQVAASGCFCQIQNTRHMHALWKIWRMLLGQEYGCLFFRFGMILGMPAFFI
jgi:hypothetical protein